MGYSGRCVTLPKVGHEMSHISPLALNPRCCHCCCGVHTPYFLSDVAAALISVVEAPGFVLPSGTSRECRDGLLQVEWLREASKPPPLTLPNPYLPTPIILVRFSCTTYK